MSHPSTVALADTLMAWRRALLLLFVALTLGFQAAMLVGCACYVMVALVSKSALT